MKIRTKASVLLIGLTTLTAALSAYSSYSGNLSILAAGEAREMHQTAVFIENSIREASQRAAARASLVATLPSIEGAFRAQDREQLVQRLGPALAIQRDRYGVREAQFHLAPATSFLRVYAPNDGHGEDLSAFREMVVMTNRRQEPQRGIEIGRRGLSIRAVDIVRDAQGAIGSFEIGMSFSGVLTDTRESTHYEAGVFVDDQQMASIATLMPRPDPERVIGGFQNSESTNWQAIRAIVSPDLLTQCHDVTTRVVDAAHGEQRGLVLIPIRDFKGAPIGCIIATRSFEDYQRQARRALYTSIAVALLQAMLLAGLVLVILNGMLLRPLAVIADKLKKMAGGDPGQSLAALPKQPDEVGAIARDTEAIAKTLHPPGGDAKAKSNA